MKRLTVLSALTVLCLVGCSDSPVSSEGLNDASLAKSMVLVAELKEKIQMDYEMFAESHDGVPVIRIKVEDPASDYASAVGPITEAIGAYEGELWVVFDREIEMTESEKASGMKDPREILARFDAKTGKRLP